MKTHLLIIFLFFNLASVFSQKKELMGSVTDTAGNGIPYATVMVENARSGYAANAYGKYTIQVKIGDVIAISALGYVPQKIKVQSFNSISTTLESNAIPGMKEVVVSGAYNT